MAEPCSHGSKVALRKARRPRPYKRRRVLFVTDFYLESLLAGIVEYARGAAWILDANMRLHARFPAGQEGGGRPGDSTRRSANRECVSKTEINYEGLTITGFGVIGCNRIGTIDIVRPEALPPTGMELAMQTKALPPRLETSWTTPVQT